MAKGHVCELPLDYDAPWSSPGLTFYSITRHSPRPGPETLSVAWLVSLRPRDQSVGSCDKSGASHLPNLSEITRTRRIRHASVRDILSADWLELDSWPGRGVLIGWELPSQWYEGSIARISCLHNWVNTERQTRSVIIKSFCVCSHHCIRSWLNYVVSSRVFQYTC